MPTLRQRLPPLNSLVAFEAVARHGTMTQAAAELLVSREAVSRQIHMLEEHLGASLFVRVHRAVELTEDGKRLRDAVRPSLEAIAAITEKLQRETGPARITVMATIAIASFWLTPRLPRFRERHPHIEIRLRASDTPLDLQREGIDLGLCYGGGTWSGQTSQLLFPTETFPVCSPDYLRHNGPIENPADLLGHTLLNLDGPAHADEDWSWWLEGAGVKPATPPRVLGFDSYANIIQAAQDGQGVALGFSRIVDVQLNRGQLVEAIGPKLSRGQAVYLVTPTGSERSPAASAFRTWLLEEAQG
jgi:LysR family glycine cleavage system transcriptional activator